MKTIAVFLSLCVAVSVLAGGPQASEGIVCFASTESPMVRKLNGIIIPKIELRDVTVAEAIEFLRLQSRRLDPERTGVNFVLKLPAEAKPSVAPPPATAQRATK